MKTAWNTKSQSDGKMRSGEANKFEERYAELERRVKHKAEVAAATQKQEMTESTVKMRSGRFVAESEHEKERLVTESEAALHSNGIAFAETTESEQAEGGPVVEAAAAAPAPHSIGNSFAESTEFEHADGRTVVGAAAALDLDDDASTTAVATCALREETNTTAREVMSKSQENKNEKISEGV